MGGIDRISSLNSALGVDEYTPEPDSLDDKDYQVVEFNESQGDSVVKYRRPWNRASNEDSRLIESKRKTWNRASN